MDSVTVRWTGNRQYVGWDEGGHSVVMDARPEHAGEGAGIRPLQAFLCALAGCTGMDVISILEKKRQRVTGIEILVEGEQRTDEYPRIYTRIHMRFTVSGHDVEPRAVARAIELSEEKYCSVRGMLGPDTAIETSFDVVEAS